MGVPTQVKDGTTILASCEFGNPPREYVMDEDVISAAVFDVSMYAHCVSQRKADPDHDPDAETDEPNEAAPPRAATTIDNVLVKVVNSMLASVDGLERLKLFFCFDDYSGDDAAKMATLRARADAHAKIDAAPFDDASHAAFYLPLDQREWYNALFASRQHKYAMYCRLHEIIYALMGDRTWCVVTGTDMCYMQRRVSTMRALQISTHPCTATTLWGGDPTHETVLVPFEHVAIAAALCTADDEVADPMLAVTAEFSNGDVRVWYTPLSLAGALDKPLELWLNDTTLLVLTVQGIALPHDWTATTTPEDEHTLDARPPAFTVTMGEAALYACGKAVKPRKTATEADHCMADLACVLAQRRIPAVYCFRDSDWLVNLVHVLHTAREVFGSVPPPTFALIRDQCYELTALFDAGNEAKLDAMRKLMLYSIPLGNDYHGGIAGAGIKALQDALEAWPMSRLPVVGEGADQEVSTENIMRFARAVCKRQYIESKGITKDASLPELTPLFEVGFAHMVDSVARLRKVSRKRARAKGE
jgi:hypothetical protein